MKLSNASITMLVGQDGTTIKVRDNDAAITFIEIKLTNDQLAGVLSRLSNTPCEAQVFGFENVGKKHECSNFVFEMPKNSTYKDRTAIAIEQCKKQMEAEGLTEWKADDYFGSQGSYFTNGGVDYAQTTIRRWV